jgi:hypothetical protein
LGPLQQQQQQQQQQQKQQQQREVEEGSALNSDLSHCCSLQ